MLIAAWILIRGFECRMRRPAAHTQPRWEPPDVLPALSVQMLGEVLANFELIRAQPSPSWTSGDATRRFSRVLLLREASSTPVTQRASSRERAIWRISDKTAR